MLKESESGLEDESLLGKRLVRRGLFPYVDEEVFRSIEIAAAAAGKPGAQAPDAWIKVVEIDYEPQRHRGNIRTGGQRYFGWMIVALDSLFQLWDDLEAKICSPSLRGPRMARLKRYGTVAYTTSHRVFRIGERASLTTHCWVLYTLSSIIVYLCCELSCPVRTCPADLKLQGYDLKLSPSIA